MKLQATAVRNAELVLTAEHVNTVRNRAPFYNPLKRLVRQPHIKT